LRGTVTGERWDSVEVPILTRGGGTRNVLWISSNIWDSKGSLVATYAQGVDITERKQAETERNRLAQVAVRRNAELEQMLFAMSHDLRTPLVTVSGFVGELRASLVLLRGLLEAGRDLPDDVNRAITHDIPESMHFIEAGTSRMSTLLSGLLRYSRLGRAALKIEKLDMNHLIAEVLSAAEFQVRESGARVEASDLPPCQGDAIQVVQVFANMVENAIKYRDPSRQLVIRISGRRTGSRVAYCVEDNGIGMPAEFREKAFLLFQQVHPQSGTGEGMGLAIVSRIADRLDGRVWLESDLGKGSRFYVELPASSF
jgi:signal transduction histidine kinase